MPFLVYIMVRVTAQLFGFRLVAGIRDMVPREISKEQGYFPGFPSTQLAVGLCAAGSHIAGPNNALVFYYHPAGLRYFHAWVYHPVDH